jgi:tetratricopeptide (TPR) repeat protein
MFFPSSARHRLFIVLGVLLVSTGFLAGCGQDAVPALSAMPRDTMSVPVPPVSPLFAAAIVALPADVIVRAPVSPPPPPADQISRFAASVGVTPPPKPPQGGPACCGLVVCEPVASGTAAPLKAFGVGCGQWLHLMAAGQPALGATPLWNSLARAQGELGRQDLRLTLPQAMPLVGMLGVTHIAVGQITGIAGHVTLTYRLWRVPQGNPLGAPVTLSGTEAQVIAGLPGLARALDARLGIPHPDVPQSVGLSPAQLGQLGATPRYPDLTDAQLAALAALAVKSPLAGMTLLTTRAITDQGVMDRVVANLIHQQPGNALVLAQIADNASGTLRPYAAQIMPLVHRFPRSYLLARMEGITQGVWGSRVGEWAAAQRCVADAPGNPAAWQERALVLGDIGQDLRQCRTADKLSTQEWASLTQTYGQWEASALQAVRLDPQYGAAWSELASAATFAGDDATARQSIWKALHLDSGDSDTVWWGLEMFQPKWLPDQSSLDKVAHIAANLSYANASDANKIAAELKNAGYPELDSVVMDRFIQEEKAAVAQHPGSGEARWQLAAILQDVGDGPSMNESLREYRAAVTLLPNAPYIRDDYGSALETRGQIPEAIVQYRKAVALDPFFAKAYYDLGWDLKQSSQFAEAKQMMYRSIQLNPNNGDVYDALGRILASENQWAASESNLRMAIRLNPYNADAFGILCGVLDPEGQYPASLAAGKEAFVLGSQDPNVHDDMADDDLHLKVWNASMTESDAALKLKPRDALAYENLGEAEIGAGKKAEARASWQTVLTLGDPRMTPIAQKMLLRYP